MQMTICIGPKSCFPGPNPGSGIAPAIAAASIGTMQLVCEAMYHRPGFDEYPWITTIFVRTGWIGYAAIAISSILALGALTFKFRNLTALVISSVILVAVFSFYMAVVFASLLPYPWWCGSTTF